MSASPFLFNNGKISQSDKLFISPNNRSFRYGDGFFETIKVMNGKILLADLHMERLFSSLQLLQFQVPVYFTATYVKENILALVKKNEHHKLARVRVTIYRGDGGLYDELSHFPNHLIQSWDLNLTNNQLNENGLVIGIYKDARKNCDKFSSLKSNNFLSYAMAALWAKQHKWNDAILLNPYDRIADATIANIFLVKDGFIKTSSLSEGAVNGVMRRHLITCMREDGLPLEETSISMNDISEASEIFLTNAIYGIRWVKQLDNNGYTHQIASMLHKKMVSSLF
jgi:branched-subunit amino acid aminotransferase/4-amino-4-deoxychorismate lyase